jgi:hypothetical protein
LRRKKKRRKKRFPPSSLFIKNLFQLFSVTLKELHIIIYADATTGAGALEETFSATDVSSTAAATDSPAFSPPSSFGVALSSAASVVSVASGALAFFSFFFVKSSVKRPKGEEGRAEGFSSVVTAAAAVSIIQRKKE